MRPLSSLWGRKPYLLQVEGAKLEMILGSITRVPCATSGDEESYEVHNNCKTPLSDDDRKAIYLQNGTLIMSQQKL
jgi:hypothetical protein